MIEKRLRIRSRAAIEAARKNYCEYCGTGRPIHVHHIRSRGAGGDDVPENLVSLCPVCHNKAHRGKISREELLRIRT